MDLGSLINRTLQSTNICDVTGNKEVFDHIFQPSLRKRPLHQTFGQRPRRLPDTLPQRRASMIPASDKNTFSLKIMKRRSFRGIIALFLSQPTWFLETSKAN